VEVAEAAVVVVEVVVQAEQVAAVAEHTRILVGPTLPEDTAWCSSHLERAEIGRNGKHGIWTGMTVGEGTIEAVQQTGPAIGEMREGRAQGTATTPAAMTKGEDPGRGVQGIGTGREKELIGSTGTETETKIEIGTGTDGMEVDVMMIAASEDEMDVTMVYTLRSQYGMTIIVVVNTNLPAHSLAVISTDCVLQERQSF
jgi:hypothetical protein